MRETSDAYWARIYGQPSFDPVTHPLWLKNAGIAFMLAYPLILGLTSADSGDEASVDRDEYGDDADDSAWNMMARCYACKDESNRHGRDVFLRRGRMSAERRRCDQRKRGTVMGVIDGLMCDVWRSSRPERLPRTGRPGEKTVWTTSQSGVEATTINQ